MNPDYIGPCHLVSLRGVRVSGNCKKEIVELANRHGVQFGTIVEAAVNKYYRYSGGGRSRPKAIGTAKRAAIILAALLALTLPARASDQYVYPGGLNQPIQHWQYPDYATMTGDGGFFSQDVGKLAFKVDDVSYWALVDVTPPDWRWIGGGPLSSTPSQGLVCSAQIYTSIRVDSVGGYRVDGVAPTGAIMRGAPGDTSAYVSPVSSQSTPANPTGTTNTTGVMMGLAGSFTTSPATSGKVLVNVSGSITNNTASDGAKIQIRHGTGSAPANGAALTGTADGSTPRMMNGTAIVIVPFSCNAVVTGLSASTTYWVDLSLAAITGGTATITDVSISAVEL